MKIINIMKKILLYGLLIIIAFNLLSKLWNSITLDEEEEVLKFSQKVEMLKSSKDYSDIRYTSKQYLSFLEENIDWFSPEQSKEISDDLNSLINFSEVKIDSIEQVYAENRLKKEEEERFKKEEEERLKKEEEERLKKEEEDAWLEKNWHVGNWDYSLEGMYIRLDLRQNGTCDLYFIDGWIYDLSYEKTSTKIFLSPISDVTLEFKVDNTNRRLYTANGSRLNRVK